MAKRVALTLFAYIGMAAVFASAANMSTAHHDTDSAIQQTDDVEHLMELAFRTCFGHGDDLTGLQDEARARGWKAASKSELQRHDSKVSEMIGGWVFTNSFGSFAVMQSKFKEGPSAFLCSITAKFPFDQHDQVKASFERRFKTALKREGDRSGKHFDAFSIKGPQNQAIAVSIDYVPSKGVLTINMIYGPGGPLARVETRQESVRFRL